METILVVAFMGILAVVVVRRWRSWSESRRIDNQRDQIRTACHEAKTIVDMTTPVDRGATPLETVMLSEVTRRTQHLEQRMQELSKADLSPRVLESVQDVRRVAGSLVCAFDAERTLRLGSHGAAQAHRARSAERIAERSYELNVAADDLQWLVESEG